MAHYAGEWPCLVVVPASMRWPWVDSLETWLDQCISPGGGASRVLQRPYVPTCAPHRLLPLRCIPPGDNPLWHVIEHHV